MPFDGQTQDEVFEKIHLGYFEMPKHLSVQCKELLRGLIEVNPNKRMTAREAINHPWMKIGDEPLSEQLPEEQ